MKYLNLFKEISCKRSALLSLLLCAALASFCAGKKDKADPKAQEAPSGKEEQTQAIVQEEEVKVKEPSIPDLTLNFKGSDLVTGIEVDQKEFAPAKLTVVNVWGTFCPPCLEELPDLERLSKQLMWQRVQVIGVLCDAFNGSSANVALAKKIIREKNVSYRNFILDRNTAWLSSVQAVPTTFIVDSKGKVVAEPIVGSRSAEEYRAIIDEALEKLKK